MAWLFSQNGFKGYHPFTTYARLPEVQQCVGNVVVSKRGGVKKWLPAMLLKKKFYFLLFAMFVLARVLHVKMKY